MKGTAEREDTHCCASVPSSVRQLPFGATPLQMWDYVTDNTEVDRM